MRRSVIEEEDHTSLSRLYLRVDERVGAIDEEDLVRRVLAENPSEGWKAG
jgi:hypothetical protein